MESINHFYVIRQVWILLRPVFEQHAYLDPGSGSFLLQLLIAALLGGAFLFRSYLKKFFGFVGRLFSRGKPTQDDDE